MYPGSGLTSYKSTTGPSQLSVQDSPSRTNNALECFHAALRRMIRFSHPNLFAFLGHIQQTMADIQADVNRVSRGTAVGRAKKRVNLINAARV